MSSGHGERHILHLVIYINSMILYRSGRADSGNLRIQYSLTLRVDLKYCQLIRAPPGAVPHLPPRRCSELVLNPNAIIDQLLKGLYREGLSDLA